MKVCSFSLVTVTPPEMPENKKLVWLCFMANRPLSIIYIYIYIYIYTHTHTCTHTHRHTHIYIYIYIYIYTHTHTQSTMKLFIHPSILNIFIHFSESNAHMMLVFLYINKHKKVTWNQIFRSIGYIQQIWQANYAK